MANAPYGVRLLVGVATVVLEETRKFPQTVLMYPMTLASQAANAVMKVQQNVADLVIKGDETLDTIFPAKDEQPEWATFDEDVDDGPDDGPADDAADAPRATEGRFALYSSTPDNITDAATPSASTAASNAVRPDRPEIADEIDYDALTLAQ